MKIICLSALLNVSTGAFVSQNSKVHSSTTTVLNNKASTAFATQHQELPYFLDDLNNNNDDMSNDDNNPLNDNPWDMPEFSPATKLRNEVYTWRDNQQIRYQAAGNKDASQVVILVHGLFVNSDHWRKTLTGLGVENSEKYRVYAIDLLGNGYSSKPSRDDSQRLSGERRFEDPLHPKHETESILKNIKLGTAFGGERVSDVDLRHPLGSCYNFYTWAEQIVDFVNMIVKEECDVNSVSLVCNSIGTMSSLQAVIDEPGMFDGVFVVNPNFRELHSAEVPLSSFAMPFINIVQRTLRENGKGLFDALAKPNTVKEILKEPYAVTSAVDDELVNVLLSPLLTPGASDVVFDTLSYSAGPLPEQQLGSVKFSKDIPVWVCYGDKDPWTPGRRVEKLINFSQVERVIKLPAVGHCPHDEAPELVNPLIQEFLQQLKERQTK